MGLGAFVVSEPNVITITGVSWEDCCRKRRGGLDFWGDWFPRGAAGAVEPAGREGSCRPEDRSDGELVGLCEGEVAGETGGLGPLKYEKTLEERDAPVSEDVACVCP